MRQMDLYDAYLQFRGGAYKSANDTDNLQFLAAETDFLELLKQGVWRQRQRRENRKKLSTTGTNTTK